MYELSPVLKQRFQDLDGNILAGGLLYTYQAGTTTPLATYTDETGGTPNTNPVVLDSSGYANVWMSANSYKFVLTDSLGNVQFTVDNVESIAQQIATQINIAGALAAVNNLSDLSSVPTALKNLGIAPYSYPTKFSVTSGQSATALTGETVDGALYAGGNYEALVIQGTTIFSNVFFSIQYLNSTWQLIQNTTIDNGTTTGVTFSLTQAGSVAQLKAAESGFGNGTILIKKSLFLATP